MGQDPEAIRREIERTREEMSDTIGAIGYKADVPSRTKDAVGDRVDSVKEKLGMASSKVSDATPDGAQVKDGAKRAAGAAQSNPLGLGIGAVAVGFLAGMLIPETKIEHEKLGPAADQIKDQVKDTASEAIDHGKQVAQEVGQQVSETAKESAATAKETVQEKAQEHGQELKDTAKDNAQQAKEGVKQNSPA